MTFELTPQQLQLLDAEQGEFPRVVDPRSKTSKGLRPGDLPVALNRNAAAKWSPWSRIAPRDRCSATSEIPRNAENLVSFAEQGRYGLPTR